jgi:hypothetical protein
MSKPIPNEEVVVWFSVHNMIPEKRKELDILINKFKSSEYEELELTEELFNVESMFPFE